MRLSFTLAAAALSIASKGIDASPVQNEIVSRQDSNDYVGYLLSTFSDEVPQVQWHLSNGNDPYSFTFLNEGSPVLTSDVGTGDLDINAEGFSWDEAVRHGSLNLVIWNSTNLVDWSEPRLVRVEDDVGGMAWAPSAVYNETTSEYYVFWASRIYDEADTNHTANGTITNIRYATTKDFESFTAPQNYVALDNISLIDQEFQYLGIEGHWARFLKNEEDDVKKVYQEISHDGIFGTWTRVGDFVRPESPVEGPGSYADNKTPGLYHLLLDNYEEYVPFETTDIESGVWTLGDNSTFPSGIKHGSVTPLMQAEYDAVAAAFGA